MTDDLFTGGGVCHCQSVSPSCYFPQASVNKFHQYSSRQSVRQKKTIRGQTDEMSNLIKLLNGVHHISVCRDHTVPSQRAFTFKTFTYNHIHFKYT